MTVILAEHEVEVMAAYADRVVVMHDGEIILNGTPEEVFQNVDKLTSIGLRVPQVTALTDALQSRRIIEESRHLPVTLDQAEALFVEKLK